MNEGPGLGLTAFRTDRAVSAGKRGSMSGKVGLWALPGLQRPHDSRTRLVARSQRLRPSLHRSATSRSALLPARSQILSAKSQIRSRSDQADVQSGVERDSAPSRRLDRTSISSKGSPPLLSRFMEPGSAAPPAGAAGAGARAGASPLARSLAASSSLGALSCSAGAPEAGSDAGVCAGAASLRPAPHATRKSAASAILVPSIPNDRFMEFPSRDSCRATPP